MRALLIAFSLAIAGATAAQAQTPDTALVNQANAGEADAALEAAMGFLEAQDVAAAQRFATLSAQAGNAEAMNLMAVLLQETDPAASHSWEDRAIAAGSDGARLNRGVRTILTDTSTEGWNSGLALLRLVEAEHAVPVLNDIAREYGRSPAATPERSFQITQLAAERGSAPAQWRYAMRLLNGDGGPRDVPAAYTWARRSAEGGYIDGMISTAVMLATGEGVSEDDAEARQWYQSAVDAGSGHALRGLAGMYLTGEGGPPDAARGWAYLTLAAERGDENAQGILQRIALSVSAEDKRSAEPIRAAWLAMHPD